MQCALPSCSEAAKQKCAACKSLGYCSREHQRSDWKSHKKECQRIVTAVAASGEGALHGVWCWLVDAIRMRYFELVNYSPSSFFLINLLLCSPTVPGVLAHRR